ncbi:MAG TPA: peroxiredoxin-like family protein [Candidatus Baltobacteraceae bacterium]|nr:peroxiredoxin-like family protein [Candidatus Baltobacteraceae bacterium]
MRLKPGDIAPEFDIEDAKGGRVRLSSFTGKKTLLVFFRYAGCPFCNLALDRLLAAYPRLSARGLNVIAFFQSDRALTERYILRRHVVPFAVVPDPTRVAYERYGVESSVMAAVRTALHIDDFFRAWRRGYPQPAIDGDFFLVPALFLIDRDLKIRTAAYGRHFSIPFDFLEIEKALQD